MERNTVYVNHVTEGKLHTIGNRTTYLTAKMQTVPMLRCRNLNNNLNMLLFQIFRNAFGTNRSESGLETNHPGVCGVR